MVRFDPKMIAIEGIDGSGKTVQTQLLQEKLQALGYRTTSLSFPHYTNFFGHEIGKMLSGKSIRADEVDPKSMALWYALDRQQLFNIHNFFGIDFVILNRFTLSNIAYQNARYTGDEDLINWIFSLEATLDIPKPNINIILDTNIQTSKENVNKKGEREYIDEPDVYESSETFLEKVRKQYLNLVNKNDVICLDIMENGKMKDKDIIHKEIISILEKHNLLGG